jgi:ubiquinone/menaquinone biosynthesis C-methylase UbiE
MSTPSPQAFDPDRFKATTRAQWDTAAAAWDRWSPLLNAWLGGCTERMLDLMGLRAGARVLDVAAGAGEQTIAAARRVGPRGSVLATDISPVILQHADRAARTAGLANVTTQVLDGEHLDVPAASFDAVISRVGLIYFPDRQKALAGMRRALVDGGVIGAIVYSTPERNAFFSIPVSIVRRRAALPPPLPGQPGPFSLGGAGVLAKTLRDAGFQDVVVEACEAPLVLPSARECVRFESESFGALHQMMSGLSEAEKAATWAEIEGELTKFEGTGGFRGPCELLVGVAKK